jgi:hypothetical protein
MVRRVDRQGGVYHEPPYTEEELDDFERRFSNGIVSYIISTGPDPAPGGQTSAGSKAPPPPEAPHPAGERAKDR